MWALLALGAEILASLTPIINKRLLVSADGPAWVDLSRCNGRGDCLAACPTRPSR